MAGKDSFVMYTEYMEQIKLLSMEQRGVLFTAIMCYVSGDDLPDMDGITAMAFSFIRSRTDKDIEKYIETIEKRKEAGKLGGRPKTNGFSEKEEKAKKANGFSEKQKNPDNDIVIDNVIDNDKDIDTTNVVSKKQPSQKDIFTTIRELYNSVCGSYPRLVKMTDDRKKAIKARMNAGYTVDDFKTLFEKAEKSDFLKGKNARNWSAKFDWLITDRNMAKVLEGNFDNTSKKAVVSVKKTAFSNAPERDYDMSDLARQLIE